MAGGDSKAKSLVDWDGSPNRRHGGRLSSGFALVFGEIRGLKKIGVLLETG